MLKNLSALKIILDTLLYLFLGFLASLYITCYLFQAPVSEYFDFLTLILKNFNNEALKRESLMPIFMFFTPLLSVLSAYLIKACSKFLYEFFKEKKDK